jgi:hypothetical protein
MARSLAIALVGVFSSLCASGCGTTKAALPTWQYGRLDPGNPVAAVKTICIAAPVFEGATVDGQPIAGYLAGTPKRAAFEEDLRRYAAKYLAGVAGFSGHNWYRTLTFVPAPGGNALVATLTVKGMQLGSWETNKSPTVIDYVVEIRNPNNEVVESFSAQNVIAFLFASGDRVALAGQFAAMTLGHYLHARQAGRTEAFVE